jgi:hypothetical protein
MTKKQTKKQGGASKEAVALKRSLADGKKFPASAYRTPRKNGGKVLPR